MSSPCNFDEAWGGLITSNRVPVSLVKKKNMPNQKFSVPPEKADAPKKKVVDKNDIECSEFLLHFMTCKHCQYKIKELSNTYMSTNQTNGPMHNFSEYYYPFRENQPQPLQTRAGSIGGAANFLSLGADDKVNETFIYIMIGLMIGYILSQIISKK
jgi:hypothetical protein